MENIEKKEEKLARYNNNLFKNKVINAFANIKVEEGILPKFFKRKIEEHKNPEKSTALLTTSEERFADYIENYLNAENKFALKNTQRTENGKEYEQNVIMFRGVPFVIEVENAELPAQNGGNLYGTTQKITYRGLKRNRFGKFEYFDIQLQTDERLYLNATESKFVNYKLFKKINSSSLVLGKNRFKTYTESMQTKPVYYTTNSTNPKIEHRKEATGSGKLAKIRQRFNDAFAFHSLRDDDQQIIAFLNENVAKFLSSRNLVESTNTLQENTIF